SFGDWKPPLPTYLMIPTIAIFGLTPLGVRLPSALLGTLTVFLTFFVVKELLDKYEYKSGPLKTRENIALVTASLLAISPWQIVQSRSAMLVAVALFFTAGGLWSFLKGLKHSHYLFICSLCFSLAIYSYYGMRLIIPLLFFSLLILFKKSLFQKKHVFTEAILLGVFLLLPLGLGFLSQPNVIFGRAKTVSIFYDKGVTLTVWDLIAQDGVGMPTSLAQFFHNKPYHYTIDIVKRFFVHLDGRFLFLTGDTHPPFQIPGMGMVYWVDGIFICLGLIHLIRHQSKLLLFIIIFISISILPAALTYVTPSQNRTFTLSLPLMMLSAIGIVSLYNFINKRALFLLTLLIIYGLSFSYFVFNYALVLPKEHAHWWHYGYKELISFAKDHDNRYDTIYISGRASVPYVFLLFYNQIDPNRVQKEIRRDLNDDEYGFEHVTAFGKYEFPRYFSWKSDGETLLPQTLLVLTEHEDDPTGEHIRGVGNIRYPNGKVAFKLFEIL
ncbi:MAG: glycosyltransferase family 39 protein, partial [Patescibacteria group bacterium]